MNKAAAFKTDYNEARGGICGVNPADVVSSGADLLSLPSGLPDNKESIQMGFVGMEGKFPSKADCPGFEDTAKQFQAKSLDLAQLLLGGFASGLGLPQDFFQKVQSLSSLVTHLCHIQCI